MLTDDDIALGFYRFEDLQELRIVENRTDLNRKQKELGFPKPIKTGNSQAAFLKVEVYAWLVCALLSAMHQFRTQRSRLFGLTHQ